jgi:hypothetical protein
MLFRTDRVEIGHAQKQSHPNRRKKCIREKVQVDRPTEFSPILRRASVAWR